MGNKWAWKVRQLKSNRQLLFRLSNVVLICVCACVRACVRMMSLMMMMMMTMIHNDR